MSGACVYCGDGIGRHTCGMCKGTGKPPRPFLRPALKETRSRIADGLREAIDIKNGDDQPGRVHLRRSHGLPPAKG